MSHENSQHYAPADPNRRSPPYYPDVQGQPSSHRLFLIPGQPFPSQSPYLGQQQHQPLPPNALGRPSPSSMPPPLTVPSPNGPSPLHNNGYANQIGSTASPCLNGDGSRLPPSPLQLHSSFEGGSSNSYPPPPPPITVAGISLSTSGPLNVLLGHQLARGQSGGGKSGSLSSRSRTVTVVEGEEPSKDHHDEEADLKSFVQLNHRDEQLFKRFMGKVSFLGEIYKVAPNLDLELTLLRLRSEQSSGLPLLFSALGFKYGNQPNRCTSLHLELWFDLTSSFAHQNSSSPFSTPIRRTGDQAPTNHLPSLLLEDSALGKHTSKLTSLDRRRRSSSKSSSRRHDELGSLRELAGPCSGDEVDRGLF